MKMMENKNAIMCKCSLSNIDKKRKKKKEQWTDTKVAFFGYYSPVHEHV